MPSRVDDGSAALQRALLEIKAVPVARQLYGSPPSTGARPTDTAGSAIESTWLYWRPTRVCMVPVCVSAGMAPMRDQAQDD
eukprot:scaffold672773_cov47-Prasinocladus_malaysianus.AAC.1